MKQAFALLAESSQESIEKALGCFMAAARIREERAGTDPWSRYNLAGSWLNAGDACARRVSLEGASEAVGFYDLALALLLAGAAEPDPLFARRRALAWFGRGSILLRCRRRELSEAARSFENASSAAQGLEDACLDAAASLGLAESLQAMGRWTEASAAARAAVKSSAGADATPDSVLLGLKARLVLCLAASRPTASAQEFDAAIDSAEEGLVIAAARTSDERLLSATRELIRWGASAYASRMPQFLLEFLREQRELLARAASPAAARAIVEQARAAGIASAARRIYSTLGKPEAEGNLDLLASLTRVEAVH